ncbi:MAG: hypothetical protein ACJA1Z_003400 [Patiriisocius sp.]|jgi:hypothetical protein
MTSNFVLKFIYWQVLSQKKSSSEGLKRFLMLWKRLSKPIF